MVRKPFLLGLMCGTIIGALAALDWSYIQRSQPTPVPSVVVPVSAAPIPTNPLPARSQWQRIPPGATPFEFNGQRYYFVPLHADPNLST
jgi:hypothetical protein